MAAYFRSVGYEPFKEQWGYHRSKARFRVVTAGRRFGKSKMCGEDVIPKHLLKSGHRTWIVGPQYSLADKRGTADFVSTPEGQNWFYDLWLLGLDPDLPEYECLKFPSWYNRVVYPGGRSDPEIKLLEKTMDAEWFKQEIGADFASFAGKIFPEWDESVHVRAHKFRPEWKNYIAFDWGYANPLAAVEFQVSPTDQIFVWRVYYKKYKTIPDVAGELLEQTNTNGYHLDLAFGDPADPEAAALMSQKLGVMVYAPKDLKANFTWLDGIMLMREFQKPDRETHQDEWGTPFYEPSFFVDPRCREVIK